MATNEGRFQERAKEHDVRSANIIAAKGASGAGRREEEGEPAPRSVVGLKPLVSRRDSGLGSGPRRPRAPCGVRK